MSHSKGTLFNLPVIINYNFPGKFYKYIAESPQYVAYKYSQIPELIKGLLSGQTKWSISSSLLGVDDGWLRRNVSQSRSTRSKDTFSGWDLIFATTFWCSWSSTLTPLTSTIRSPSFIPVASAGDWGSTFPIIWFGVPFTA